MANPLTESNLGKSKLDRENGPRDLTVREEEETPHEGEGRSASLEQAHAKRPQLEIPLQKTQSRSSQRSHRSYTADGYGYYQYDEKDDQQPTKDPNDPDGKEFEVQFDGDADPMNPKNRTSMRKWLICILVSASALCVVCCRICCGIEAVCLQARANADHVRLVHLQYIHRHTSRWRRTSASAANSQQLV